MNTTKAFGIAALACACAASVYADDNSINNVKNWFSGAAAEGVLTKTKAVWNDIPSLPDGVTVSEATITLENDADHPLVLTPDAAPDTGTKVVITGSAAFSPMEAESLGEVVMTGAQAAFTLAKDNEDPYYYGWAGDKWEQLGAATMDENAETLPVNFTVTLSYYGGKTNVTFAVNGVNLTNPGPFSTTASAGTVASISCYGTGTLTLLEGTAELAEFVDPVTGNKYADKAAAEQAGVAVEVSEQGAKQLIIAQEIPGITTDEAAGALVSWMNGNGIKEDVDQLTTKIGDNNIALIENYKLGLDPNEETDVPKVTTVETDAAENAITLNATLNAAGVNPPTGFKAVWKIDDKETTVNDGKISVPTTTGTYKVAVEAVPDTGSAD